MREDQIGATQCYGSSVAEAVLLDLDRTLVDLQSYTDYDAAWAAVQEHVPADLIPEALETGWSSATRACMGVLAALPDGDLWWTISNLIAEFEAAAIPSSVTMPGAYAFAYNLRDSARAVVTLLPVDVARDVLVQHNIDIPIVLGRDPKIRPKPSGDGLRRALELLEVPPTNSVMIGDSTWDAAAAVDAGVPFMGVHSPQSEFGEQFPDVVAHESLADVFIALHRG
jgi:phosphoglycolate phosphatase-like HAD superfamily hydrolase